MSVRNLGHIKALDGVRGLAALAVVISHLDETSKSHFVGEIGVTAFFCLSGFLMAFLYLDRPFSKEAALDFGFRRFARIAPIYWLTGIFCFVLFHAAGSIAPYEMTSLDLFRHLLFYGHVDVFWSVPPEVQFYLLFPLIWFAVDAARFGNQGPVLQVACVAAGAFVLSRVSPGIIVASKLHDFLAGLILGVARLRITAPVDRTTNTVFQILGSGILIGALAQFRFNWLQLYPSNFDYPTTSIYMDYRVTAMCAALVFVSSLGQGLLSAFLGSRPLVYLGAISFSLYLTHRIVFLSFPKAIGHVVPGALIFLIAILLAAAVHHAFELPVQRVVLAALRRAEKWRSSSAASTTSEVVI